MATTTDDRPDRALLQQAIHWLVELRSGEMTPVSYTHLTLPTIYSV